MAGANTPRMLTPGSACRRTSSEVNRPALRDPHLWVAVANPNAGPGIGAPGRSSHSWACDYQKGVYQ